MTHDQLRGAVTHAANGRTIQRRKFRVGHRELRLGRHIPRRALRVHKLHHHRLAIALAPQSQLAGIHRQPGLRASRVFRSRVFRGRVFYCGCFGPRDRAAAGGKADDAHREPGGGGSGGGEQQMAEARAAMDDKGAHSDFPRTK